MYWCSTSNPDINVGFEPVPGGWRWVIKNHGMAQYGLTETLEEAISETARHVVDDRLL